MRGASEEATAFSEFHVSVIVLYNNTSPVTFWVGSNHGASVLKLETLD